MKFPSLTIDQKIIAIIILTLVAVGAAFGADYRALWPKERDLVVQPGKEGVATGVFERRGEGEEGDEDKKEDEEEVRETSWIG
jgi:hypothetical protein